MADQFLSEIRPFGFNFAPTGWAQCNGQLMPLSQNTALFALLGTNFGGDGKSTFALPNLQNSTPMHHGVASGLSERDIGEQGGSATVTLLQSEIPAHTHGVNAAEAAATERQPAGQMFAVGEAIGIYGVQSQPATGMHPSFLAPAGSSLPHNNVQPSLVINLCIALQGVFPQRQ